jgi:hypothetical protein
VESIDAREMMVRINELEARQSGESTGAS